MLCAKDSSDTARTLKDASCQVDFGPAVVKVKTKTLQVNLQNGLFSPSLSTLKGRVKTKGIRACLRYCHVCFGQTVEGKVHVDPFRQRANCTHGFQSFSDEYPRACRKLLFHLPRIISERLCIAQNYAHVRFPRCMHNTHKGSNMQGVIHPEHGQAMHPSPGFGLIAATLSSLTYVPRAPA